MAATDSPLKRLITTFIDDFAMWLLESEVVVVTPHNIELYALSDPIRADQIFTVKLADGRSVILHIEFQGRRSEVPMPLRELDSLSRLGLKFRDFEIYSVVFYVGKGAGRNDTGSHQIKNPTGGITLSWQYKVIHLWKMNAEELMNMGKPALLGLIGQTQITDPEVLLPKVVERLKSISDAEMQKRLLSEMMLLINDEKVLTMLENLIEANDILEETPLMRRLRSQGGEERSRHDILKIVELRFKPLLPFYQQIEQQLAGISNGTKLDVLLTTAVQCDTIADFQKTLDNVSQS
jgi:hypothetical protein